MFDVSAGLFRSLPPIGNLIECATREINNRWTWDELMQCARACNRQRDFSCQCHRAHISFSNIPLVVSSAIKFYCVESSSTSAQLLDTPPFFSAIISPSAKWLVEINFDNAPACTFASFARSFSTQFQVHDWMGLMVCRWFPTSDICNLSWNSFRHLCASTFSCSVMEQDSRGTFLQLLRENILIIKQLVARMFFPSHPVTVI